MDIAAADYSEAISRRDYVDKQFVFVECRQTPGDGGAGIWQFDQSSNAPDDGGTVLRVETGGVLSRVYSGALDVRWFGAVGDGHTDNSKAISNAVSAAVAKGYGYGFGIIAPEPESLGGNLYFPPGTYLVRNNIESNLASPLSGRRTQGIRIFGVRFKSVILLDLDPREFLFDSYVEKTQTFLGLVFSDLAFVGARPYGKNGGFMRIWSNGQSGKFHTFERTHFGNLNLVLDVQGKANADIMAFFNCRFEKITGSVLSLNNPESVVHQFQNCEMHGDAKAMFMVHNGGCISWTGGSIVNGRSHAEGGHDSDQWLVEYRGSSHGNNRTTFENVRFERRGTLSRLIKASKNATTRTTFQNCTWAGPRNQGRPRTVVDLHGQHLVEFIRCGLYINQRTERDYRYKLKAHRSGPFESSQPIVRFVDCEMPPPSIVDFEFGDGELSGLAIGTGGFCNFRLNRHPTARAMDFTFGRHSLHRGYLDVGISVHRASLLQHVEIMPVSTLSIQEICQIILPENATIMKFVLDATFVAQNNDPLSFDISVGRKNAFRVREEMNTRSVRIVMDNLFINVGHGDDESRTVSLRNSTAIPIESFKPNVAYVEYL